MKDFLSGLQDRFSDFMLDRNGMDSLAIACFFAGLACTILEFFVGSLFLTLVALALLGYALFRCYSRNHIARQQEAQKFDLLMEKPKSWVENVGAKAITISSLSLSGFNKSKNT